MDVSSEDGASGGLTAVSTTSLRIDPVAVGTELLSVGIVLVLGPVEDVLHKAPIGGIVTRSPLIQQRLKNRVASNISLSHDDSRSRDRCPGRVEVASLKEHVPIRAKNLPLTPSDSALNSEEALLRCLRKAGTVGVESPVHKHPPVIG